MPSLRRLTATTAITAVTAACAAVLLAPEARAAGPIRVELFSAFNETVGSRIDFSGALGTQTVAAIDFGSESSQWWPNGEFQRFGARLSANLQAAATGSYTLTLGSDDASYLFIDSQLVLALPQSHSYYTTLLTLNLAAGSHSMELQFYNEFCCGSRLSLDPGGLAFASAVPEPAQLPLWLAGGLAVAMVRRRQTR